MNKDNANTSDNSSTANNSNIEDIITDLKNKIRENAFSKTKIDKEIKGLQNENPKKDILLKLKENLTKLINNPKEQIKIYRMILKNLNNQKK
ncbi:hypothetical protein [Candidatus Phytoplasma ziziphi]|uniref:hypothetical protein n=1 Tax=Candidatus Phytoplasma TaxID=33926 RepID=UPI001F3A7CEC|nr:hypothetical protein [Candidatus Phytoplasma ziziphi]